MRSEHSRLVFCFFFYTGLCLLQFKYMSDFYHHFQLCLIIHLNVCVNCANVIAGVIFLSGSQRQTLLRHVDG